MLTQIQKEIRHAQKVSDYKDVEPTDDLWFLDVLVTMQSEGKITYGEFGMMAGSCYGK
jgi:hypothetical protein